MKRAAVILLGLVVGALNPTAAVAQSSGEGSGSAGCAVGVCDLHGHHGGGAAGSGGTPGGGGTNRGGGGTGCSTSYRLVPDGALLLLHRERQDYIDQITQPKFVTGEYYYVYDCDGNATGQVVFIPTGSPAPAGVAAVPVVDPATLAADALKRMTFPLPAIHLNPDATRDQLVGLTTWLWVDSNNLGTKSETVTAGPVAVTGTLKASSVVWDMGDGHTVACPGSGSPYDATVPDARPTCSYTYTRSSAAKPNRAYTITATISWAGNYTVTGAPGGGALGPVSRSSTVTVRVGENQAINTN